MAENDVLTARARYSEAMLAEIGEPDRTRLRTALTRIGNDTILSPRTWSGDAHVGRYSIKPGDTLGEIAKAHKISAGLLASINNIENINLIRAGQVIKVIYGPFRAVVHKHEYVLDVYLGDTFVTHFKVGLGADDGTPTGTWRVGTKLRNPTYYPPRGGQMIAADDPANPLGERWIALIGADGDALGAQRYGIHGTIEPNSIGHSVSLGCIRMYNDDVAQLYAYLVETHSTVRVLN
ncbi:MAG: L,D-transpeptidase family protein [Phycisphaerae bacterium]